MANGEGYLRKRGKDSWTITIFLGKDEHGKARQLVKTVRGSEKDAQAELSRLVVERNQGVELKPETVTFRELSGRWLETKSDLAPSTRATYETLLRVHVEPVLGKLKLRDVKPLHIESVKSGVIRKGRSQKLALNVYRLVDALLKQSVLWQLLSRNPCDSVAPPKAKRFIAHTPTPEELDRLFTAADRTAYGVVARLAALTGARQGELLRMAWRDVDWENQLLKVPGTKTEASARTIDLGGIAITLLKEHRVGEREKRIKLGAGSNCGSDEATIFTNQVGKPMEAGGLKRTWKRILRDADVGHVRFHDLRHASATYMLQAGVPLQMVSARLGHSRTSTTADVYSHVLPGMGRQAAEALEKVIGG